MGNKGSYQGGGTVIHTGRPHAAHAVFVKKRKKAEALAKKRRQLELGNYEVEKSKGLKSISADEIPEYQKVNHEKKRKQKHSIKPGKKAQKKAIKKNNAFQTAKKLMEQSSNTSTNLELLIHVGMEAGLKRAAAEQIAKQIRIKIYGR